MKKMISILAFAVLVSGGLSLSANTETVLKKDMLLQTICPNLAVWFKEGTKVVRDDNDKALSGTLAKDMLLSPIGRTDKIWFKAGSVIVIDKTGKIPSGILAKETQMRPSGYGSDIILKGGSSVVFHPNGALKEATLSKTALIPVAGGKAFEFKPGLMRFDEKNCALSGMIAKNRKFFDPDGNTISVYKDSFVELNAAGQITNRPPRCIVTKPDVKKTPDAVPAEKTSAASDDDDETSESDEE